MEVPTAKGDPVYSKYPSLTPPSQAYQEAFGSPVYRLSELMFGSLLASYVLGFIGFVAAYSRPDLTISSGEVLTNWDQVLVRLPFLFISITYAYITAGFYVSYHAGIMTMHQMPLGHISFDFALALSQALIFGISMIYPMYFPALLAVTLLLAVSRQHQEHRQLVASVWEELYPPLKRNLGKNPRIKKN